MAKPSVLNIFSSALLITGITIGIGIFGLPVKIGLAGIVPSVIAMLISWAVMYITGWIIAQRMLESKNSTEDISGLFGSTLGLTGKLLTVLGYFILLYGCMVAHLAAGASVLSKMIDSNLTQNQWVVISFVAATGLCLFGLNIIRQANALLLAAMIAAFFVLVYLCGKNVQPERYLYMDWYFVPATIPIIATALAYHPIIPSICRSLQYDRNAIKKALLIGTLIPLIVNIIWCVTVIGALPLTGDGDTDILYAFNNGEPATVPLAKAYAHSPIEFVSMVFSIIALTVSYVLLGASMTGFLSDILSSRPKFNTKVMISVLTYIPPLIVALLYPNLFLKALDVVGGVSIMLLFCILPALVALKYRGGSKFKTACLFLLLVVASLFMGLELMQEFGFMRITPEMEYWQLGN